MTTTSITSNPPAKSAAAGMFQVHVGGLLDVVSRHLYSQGPQVFVRELLQNGVDACGMWQVQQPGHVGRIDFEVTQSEGSTTIMVADDGIGLTWEQALPCLATIGYSSKRTTEAQANGAIGQFGIGLLSGFMVADQIHVVSRSREPGARGFWWKGNVGGEWQQGEIDDRIAPGTKVFLRLRADQADRFNAAEIRRLVQRFGGYLPIPVYVRTGDHEELITGKQAPWDLRSSGDEAQLLEAGQHFFSSRFAGAFTFESASTGTRGVAFIESEAVSPGADPGHWLFVKRMLIGDRVRGLAPASLPFLRVAMNSEGLRVNAAREGLHGEETRLEGIHADLGDALDRYLAVWCDQQPKRAASFVITQVENLLRAVDENGQFLPLLRRFYPLETTLGTLTVDEIIRRHGKLEYVEDESDYFRVELRARQEGVCLVRASYRQASQLVHAVERALHSKLVRAVLAGEFLARFSSPIEAQTDRERHLLTLVTNELHTENCAGGFTDGDNPYEPTTLVMDDEESISRLLGQSFTGNATADDTDPMPQKQLLLNRSNRVIEQWLNDRSLNASLIRRWIRVFYHHALLAARETPTAGEQRRYSRAVEDLAVPNSRD